MRQHIRSLFFLLISFVFLSGFVAYSEDITSLLDSRDTSNKRISLYFRHAKLDTIIEDLKIKSNNINIVVKAPSLLEEQDLLATPLTVELSSVTWETALYYVADKLKLTVNKSKASDGIIYLEKVARFTDVFDGVRLGDAIREISRRGNANIIITPQVQTDSLVYLSFTDVPWREALESVLKTHGCTILTDPDNYVMRIATIDEADSILETRTRPLRYIQPVASKYKTDLVKGSFDDFVEKNDTDDNNEDGEVKGEGRSLINALNAIKSADGSVSYESRTNTLIMRDTPLKIKEMLLIVDEVDVPPQQVLIESRLMTMEDTPYNKLGMMWGNSGEISVGVTEGPSWNTAFPFRPGKNFGNLGLGVLNPTERSSSNGGGSADIATGRMSLQSLRFMLEAAERNDSIRITQAPQVLAIDNEEASVFIGSEMQFPMPNRTNNDDGNPTFAIDTLEILVGVQLMVTPHICRGTDQVILEVVPIETDEPIVQEFDLGQIKVTIPVDRKVKSVHTKMMLHSTETGVIAGLLKHSNTQRTRNVPFLSKIPVFGKAFQHKEEETIKSNTMILVTPTIVPPSHSDNFDIEIEKLKERLASRP